MKTHAQTTPSHSSRLPLIHRALAAALAACVLMGAAQPVPAVVIFHDDFTQDPAGTALDGRSGSSATPLSSPWTKITTATSTITGNGAQVFLNNTTNGTTRSIFGIQRTISTVGFTNLTLEVTAFQAETPYEQDDYFQIEYSTNGVDFTPLVTDHRALNSPISTDPVAGAGEDGMISVLSTDAISLDAALSGQPNFIVRITVSTNTNPEDYYLESVTLSGDVVPEPAPTNLFIGLGLGLLAWRRVPRKR